MFEFLKNWFKKKETAVEPKKASKSDAIRKYVKGKYIIPLRVKKEKQVTFSAREIAHGMSLEEKYPMICSSIDSKKFLEYAKVALVRREGPNQGSTAKWTFRSK